jgi:hypothetical protein
MKWNEMSVFQRVLHVICWVCALIYLALFILSIADILPSVYEYALPQALFGCALLCQAVILWKSRRGSAIFNLVLGVIDICLAIAHCILK